MGREIDWGAAEYGAQFALMVRAVHIKYRDGGGGLVEVLEYTHSIPL